MLLLIKYTLLYGIVLMLVALGGMFSEHSGIINIALEGIMVIGGVAGVLTLTMLPASMSPFLVVLISILVAALAGVIYSLLLAFASINLKADQTIGGTALNLLAPALVLFLIRAIVNQNSMVFLIMNHEAESPLSSSSWFCLEINRTRNSTSCVPAVRTPRLSAATSIASSR